MGDITNFPESATNLWYCELSRPNYKSKSVTKFSADIKISAFQRGKESRAYLPTSPSRPQDIHEEIAKLEEVFEPKYIYEFETVEMSPEEMIDM